MRNRTPIRIRRPTDGHACCFSRIADVFARTYIGETTLDTEALRAFTVPFWEGGSPRLQAKPSGGLGYFVKHAGIPTCGAHGVRVALPLRVCDKVPQAGAARRSGTTGAGSDTGDLSEPQRGDIARSGEGRPCASVGERTTIGSAEPTDAGREGEDEPPPAAGVSATQEGVLGAAPVGTWIFRVQQWKCHGRDDKRIH